MSWMTRRNWCWKTTCWVFITVKSVRGLRCIGICGIDRADFAFKVFDTINPWCCHQVIRQENFKSHNHRYVAASEFCADNSRPGSRYHLQIACEQRHKRLGCPLDIDDVDVEAVFLKMPMSLATQKTEDEPTVGEI